MLSKKNLINNTEFKRQADALLYERGLLEMLQRYGKPHVSGSYALDLMTWHDLDIYLEVDSLHVDLFFDLGKELNAGLKPGRMNYRNETILNSAGLPRGLYWGIYMEGEINSNWKIDIWMVDRNEYDRLHAFLDKIKQQLTEENREIILAIKRKACKAPEYRKYFTSLDIYRAVLEKNIVDYNDFIKSLEL